ncbi:MAG: hypothetical protein GY771_11175 [bacterium]|nr:hypothetical protein [bacterium]
MKKTIILYLFLSVSVFLLINSSCDTTLEPTEPTWFYYTTADGLVSNMVYAIWPGPDGIWFATGAGVTRIHGAEVDTYTADNSALPSNDCFDVCNENLQYTWVATDGGAARIDGDGNIVVFDDDDGLPANRVVCIVWDGLHVWLGTISGLARYDDPGFTVFTTADGLPGNDIRDIFPVDSEEVWVATDNGVAHYDEGNITIYNSTTVSGMPSNDINCVTVKDGERWFGSANDGVFRYLNGELTVYNSGTDGLFSSLVNDVAYSPYGKLFVATAGGGASRFDEEEGTFSAYRENNGMPTDNVMCVIGDYNAGPIYDYIYFGTDAGAARLGLP